MEREMVTAVGGGAGAGSAQCPGVCRGEGGQDAWCVSPHPHSQAPISSLLRWVRAGPGPPQEGEPHGAERLSAGGRPGVSAWKSAPERREEEHVCVCV